MPPWMMPWYYPMGNQGQQQEDPFKMYRKFRKFLKMEQEEHKHKKDVHGRHEVRDLAIFLLLSMVIIGPATFYIIHMLEQSIGTK